MEKRNLIIGGFTNYGINELKPWVLSAREVAKENTDIVLMVGKTDKETIQWLEGEGISLYNMADVPNIPIHVLRFLSIYEFLRHNWADYKFVVTTDVKDVYFQSDPFERMESIFVPGTTSRLIIASEELKYKDESWGDENLMQTYGPYVYEQFKNNTIYNICNIFFFYKFIFYKIKECSSYNIVNTFYI